MRIGLLILTGVLLSGCTFITFPLVPDPVSVELPVVPRTEGLKLEDKTLSLKVSIPSGEGYLGVIWYQQDKELGRESIYIDETLQEVTFKQTIDPAKPYRAVLLYQKKIIRQYEYKPPEPEKTEPETPAPATPAEPGTGPAPENPAPENPAPENPEAGETPPEDPPAGELPAEPPPTDPSGTPEQPGDGSGTAP